MSAGMEALRLGLPLPAYMTPVKSAGPAKGVCLSPGPCANAAGCILMPPPLILKALSDWRADPYPYPLRADTHARAVWPKGLDS